MLNHELVRLSLVTVIGVTVLLFRPSVRFAKVTSPSEISRSDRDVSRRDLDLYSGGEVLRFNSLCIASYASCCAWLQDAF